MNRCGWRRSASMPARATSSRSSAPRPMPRRRGSRCISSSAKSWSAPTRSASCWVARRRTWWTPPISVQGASLPGAVTLPAELPSTVLERRPDIGASEALLESAAADIGVARAEMFPRISLTGLFGSLSTELGDLFTKPAETWTGIGRHRAAAVRGRSSRRERGADQGGSRAAQGRVCADGAVGIPRGARCLAGSGADRGSTGRERGCRSRRWRVRRSWRSCATSRATSRTWSCSTCGAACSRPKSTCSQPNATRC